MFNYNPNLRDLDHLPLQTWLDERESLENKLKLEHHQLWQRQVALAKEKTLACQTGEAWESNLDSMAEFRIPEKKPLDLIKHPDILAHYEKFFKGFNFLNNFNWIVSQTNSRLGTKPIQRNSQGLYSPKQVFLEYIRPNRQLLAMYYIYIRVPRSMWVQKQTQGDARGCSSMVPLILAAFKQYQNISYRDWVPEELFGLVEPGLLEAMQCKVPLLQPEEILQARQQALLIKSGPKAGETRNPATTYALYLPKDNPIAQLPTLAKHMVLQTWCSHPQNYHKLQVGHPNDWDGKPQPLIQADPLANTTAQTHVDYATTTLPW